MKERTLFLSIVTSVCAVILLNQCLGSLPMQAEQQKDIAETTIEILYDEPVVIWWDEDTYPITMTCELRDDEGAVVAGQQVTWTVPVAEEYTPDPVVEPVSLTWKFADPLPPGKYDEYCMFEVDGHYGRSDTEQDGNFYKMNEWRAPSCYGLFFKGR